MANRVLGRLKKAFRSRSLNLWRVLYLAYIRPHLEFAVQAWSPHLRRYIKSLEQIQSRATKTISTIKHLPDVVRLRHLGLTTLEKRRERGDLIEQYKITYGIDEVNFYVPQTQPNWQATGSYGLRGHDRRLLPQRVKGCEERKHFFTNRVPKLWNRLPRTAINAATVNGFKDQLALLA
jgi:hypothetical protein